MKNKLSIFDIDDTLFKTTAKITVIKNGSPIRTLSNQEYNTHSLRLNETYDFSEFRDSEKFFNESKPIKRMFYEAKRILNNPNNTVMLLTARGDFDNKELFLDTFRKYDFDIDKVRVERAGKILDIDCPAKKKYLIIYNQLKSKPCDTISLYDDSINNLKEFLKLKSIFPNSKFMAYLVKPCGSFTQFNGV